MNDNREDIFFPPAGELDYYKRFNGIVSSQPGYSLPEKLNIIVLRLRLLIFAAKDGECYLVTRKATAIGVITGIAMIIPGMPRAETDGLIPPERFRLTFYDTDTLPSDEFHFEKTDETRPRGKSSESYGANIFRDGDRGGKRPGDGEYDEWRRYWCGNSGLEPRLHPGNPVRCLYRKSIESSGRIVSNDIYRFIGRVDNFRVSYRLS